MLPRQPIETPPGPWWRLPLAVGAIVGALVAWRAVVGSPYEPRAPAATASASAEPAPKPPVAPRCAEVASPTGPFVVGDAPTAPRSPPPSSAPSGGVLDDPGQEADDPTAPFAVEVGRGAVYDGGFAVGARRDAEGGAVAMVATIGADGTGGKLVRLGRSRGDLDPPVLAGAGASVVVAMVEPNAGGRAIKVARVTGGEVTWGPEFSEGRDDSLAVDVAASGGRAMVVWDDILGPTAGARRESVVLGALDVATMRPLGPSRPITAASADATAPRLALRPGGFWLAYLARGDEDPKKKREAKKPKPGDDDEDEDQGEAITSAWVELLPLDEAGTPAAAARAVTPKKGHVLSFDLAQGDDGGALLAWRDDDTPTGSAGGRMSVTLVKLGGAVASRVVDEAGGAGAPALLPGWISLASPSGMTRLAALSPRGELLDDLAPEPSLGAGEPIAATSEAILWARPLGKAMRLGVVRCSPRPAEEPSGDAGAR
jgi:hypothetical protein